MKSPPSRLQVEFLEAREVPATLVSPTTVTYQDVDGDAVTVKFSKAFLTPNNVENVFAFDMGDVKGDNSMPQKLKSIALLAFPEATGSSITVTAAKVNGSNGDGYVNVGQIDANVDLGAVSVDGDLGRIEAGDPTVTGTALKSLKAHSMGRFGLTTGADNLHSEVKGTLGSLTIKSDLDRAYMDVWGADGDIGSINVGGSLIGSAVTYSGFISATGDIGKVKIGGSLLGDMSMHSGSVYATGSIASISVRGSLQGGSGKYSGSIHADGNLGPTTIGGDVVGDTNEWSGSIFCAGKLSSAAIGGDIKGGNSYLSGLVVANKSIGTLAVNGDIVGGSGQASGGIVTSASIKSVTVGGSVVGGMGSFTGMINTAGEIKSLTIRHDLVGGSTDGTDDLTWSGVVQAGRIAKMTVGGSVIAGVDNTQGKFAHNGAIRTHHDIGTLVIKGNLLGNPTNAAIVSARGQENPTATSDIAIGKLTVNGKVEYAKILAGVDTNGNPMNADAQIGSVVVGGDWIASSLVAGAVPGLFGFGTVQDAKMSGMDVKDDAGIQSRVGSLRIGGIGLGTTESVLDHYGIVAENVSKVAIGGVSAPLTTGSNNDSFSVGTTNDFKVNEI